MLLHVNSASGNCIIGGLIALDGVPHHPPALRSASKLGGLYAGVYSIRGLLHFGNSSLHDLAWPLLRLGRHVWRHLSLQQLLWRWRRHILAGMQGFLSHFCLSWTLRVSILCMDNFKNLYRDNFKNRWHFWGDWGVADVCLVWLVRAAPLILIVLISFPLGIRRYHSHAAGSVKCRSTVWHLTSSTRASSTLATARLSSGFRVWASLTGAEPGGSHRTSPSQGAPSASSLSNWLPHGYVASGRPRLGIWTAF
mmetsp:Transcript_8757/g.19236  ORF Transcript_8757/g.19236 Transcript_8757/m.19236 type:complete len:252 (+) Transcript_8757:111-866(+)